MPTMPLFHPNERVDHDDLTAVVAFPRDLDNLLTKYRFLDRQSRIMRGFRIELPDQTQFPGRVIIHNGFGMQYDGQHLFNESQLDVSRMITLEGTNTTFYVEIEFIESESTLDGRAFWDATVDQGYYPSGDEKPDGQEFYANVATRKTPDWKVIINTGGFERDQIATLDSNRVPLVKLATDGSNEITLAANANLQTEKGVSTMMRYISTTQIVVKEPWLFNAGETISITDASGSSASSITAVDNETGLLTIATITPRTAGAIVQVTSAAASNFIIQTIPGRYRMIQVDSGAPNHVVDWRDMFFQGDEIHGEILSKGHSAVTDRDDVNLQGLKDYVDFLSAQVQEMKWGVQNPYASGTADERVPPGVAAALPTTPRYFDRAGGIMGARTAAITVGDGVSSYGDINGADQISIQKAHDSLPAIGGRIFLKRGTYSLTSDVNWTNTGSVVLEGESGTVIELDGGSIHIATTGSVHISHVEIKEGTSAPSNVGILFDTSNPTDVIMTDVKMTDAAINFNASLPDHSSFLRVYFSASTANMATVPLMSATGVSGRLSGTFNQCSFLHFSAVGLTASLIDLVTATPTVSCGNMNFVDCEFGSLLLNTTGVHLGTTASIVAFNRCSFASAITLSHVHITGGSNLKFVNCVGEGGVAALLYAWDTTYISIDGYLNANSVGQSAASFTDCNNVTVKNCDVKVNAGASLSVGAFRFANSTEVLLKNFSFNNNVVRGDETAGINKTVGVLVDIGAGFLSMIDGVKISSNIFDTCEVAIYFANTGTGGFYRNITVSANEIYDYDAFLGQADTAKIGILFGSASTKDNVTITSNIISDLNPATTDLVGGLSRAGIAITGGANRRFTITGNAINVIGTTSGGNELPDTCGIYIVTLTKSVISSNAIQSIYGAGAFGIKASNIKNSTISTNAFDNIQTVTGGGGLQESAFGIYADNLFHVTVGSNSYSNIDNAGIAVAGAMGVINTSAGQWSNVSITGNNFEANTTYAYMVYANANVFRRIVVTGNVLTGTSYRFSSVSIGTGGILETVTYSGNSGQGMTSIALSISAAAATTKRNLTINGNTFYSANKSITVDDVQFMSINGNTLETTGDNENIDIENCLRFTIDGNTVAKAAGTAIGILVSGTSNYYQINANVCDASGGTSSSINTTGAAQTGDASVMNNLTDGAVSAGTDNVGLNNQY